MDLIVAFAVFIGAMLVSLITDHSMIFALLIGLVAFLAVGKFRGFTIKNMLEMSSGGIKDSMIVVAVMLTIGMLTASWRISGTITVFVYYGMKIILPHIFLLVAFVLCCLLSYAIGTSFGIAGTVGVVFMALARSGGVNPVIAAGVILSGVYFGDRCSPVSSSANLVAGLTNTKIYDNVKLMFKTGMIPLVISLVAYTALSVTNPISHVDEQMIATFEEEFAITPWAFVPAILMIALPLLKVNVIKAMAVSIVCGILVACFTQGASFAEVIDACIFGYTSDSDGIGTILNGGGLVSMLEIVVILIISSMYSGIFNGTGILLSLQDKLGKACTKLGRFAIMTCLSISVSLIFCNQTIGTLMCDNLLKQPYLDGGGTEEELAIDMENSIILIAALVPWSIACSVPLALFGVDFTALAFAVYMYAVPICYLFTKKKWFRN